MKKAFCLVILFILVIVSLSFASFEDMAKMIPADTEWVLRFQNNSENYDTLKDLPTGDLLLNQLGIEMLIQQQINQIKFQQEVNTDALMKLIKTSGMIFGTTTFSTSIVKNPTPSKVGEEVMSAIKGIGVILPVSSSLEEVKTGIEKVFFTEGAIETRKYNNITYYAFRSNEKDTLFLYPTASDYMLVSNEKLLEKCIDTYANLKPNISSTPYGAYVIRDTNDWINGFEHISEKDSPVDLLTFRGYFSKNSFLFDVSSRPKKEYLLSEEEVNKCFASPMDVIKKVSTEFQGVLAMNLKDLPFLYSKWNLNSKIAKNSDVEGLIDGLSGDGAVVLTFNPSSTSTTDEEGTTLASPTVYLIASIKNARGKQSVLNLIAKRPTKQVSKYGGTLYTINPDNPASSTIVFLDDKRVVVCLTGEGEEHLSSLVGTPQKTYEQTPLLDTLKSILEPRPTVMIGILNAEDIFQKAFQSGGNNIAVFQVFWGNDGLLYFRTILR